MRTTRYRADAPISVVMATYNGQRFICSALESLFAQRHPPLEIIVVDDGSTDGTLDTLQPFLGRIRYFAEPHRGLSAASNWGIAQARGELVAFLDVDDYYLPDHLERLVECYASDPKAGLVQSGWRMVEADGALIREVKPWNDSPRLDLKAWLVWKPARMGATLVERRWLERAGGFDERLVQCQDVDLMLRLAVLGCRSIWLRDTTLCVRLHQDNMTRQGMAQAEDLEQVLDYFFSLPGLPASVRQLETQVRRDTAVWAAWHLWQTGYRPQALARLRASLALASWTADQSALRWMIRFHIWTKGKEKSPVESEEAVSLLREATGLSSQEWARVEAQYEWYCRVLLPYSQGEPWDFSFATSGPISDGRQLREFIAPILSAAPQPVEARTVSTLWDQLAQLGMLRGAARQEVTALYLALFVESLWRQDCRRAGSALACALGQGLNRVSLRAWRNLLRSASRHMTGQAKTSSGAATKPTEARGVRQTDSPQGEKGLVSVIIPAHNQGSYLVQAVESVLNLDGPRREVIVIDDGSTDGTAEMLASRRQQLTYIRQTNQGPAAARNRGLGIARGEFILFLDADDFLLPGTLNTHFRQLISHPCHGFSHSGWRFVDAEGEPIADVTPWEEVPKLDLEHWLLWKPVFLGSMMFRRSWLDRIGGFDTRLVQAEDVDLLLRLSLTGCHGEWVHSVTVCRRRHSTNLTRDSLRQAQDLEAVLMRFFSQPAVPRRARHLEKMAYFFTLLWISWYLIQADQADVAACYLGRTQMYSRLLGKPLTLKWLGDLAGRAKREPGGGIPVARLRKLWPSFRRASKMDPVAWEEAQRALDFWVGVWQPYTDGDSAQGRIALTHFPQLTARELVAHARAALLESHEPVRRANLDKLWEDALREGIVAPKERAQLIDLYLALAARALQRRWGRSLFAITVPVIGRLSRPQAWGPALRATVRLGHEMAGRVGEWR